ncbi:hypothetical protein [Chamaesiphon polymorphus]|uniref:DUF4926 domain-containing protein n=1 Tax=Chamaesiphon polymorphus CCALA 037 TaxID=2107692 RepID=A0A2T1G6R9_9CYAN|nr:hypothetical protein [Chamaesiphon polymorphus]PSB52903.1 hypothetical protein C7B77_20040 [Chamaesiphon polymorphus CCALA 037]
MMPTIDKLHKFQRAQRVSFAGGEGIVRSIKFEAQHWTYLIEMPLGQEPTFGRVGAETMVLLSETELRAARS